MDNNICCNDFVQLIVSICILESRMLYLEKRLVEEQLTDSTVCEILDIIYESKQLALQSTVVCNQL
jgi:hypothetical protein